MKKLKVIIVDDEYLIRNLIKKRINWEEHDMTIAGEASTAREALNMVDVLKPDIIFTDICMPSIDGIQFSRMVFEKYPNIKIVIITGHDEFKFAQKSIKLGIADFILKPISAYELLSVTDKLKKQIYKEMDRKKTFEKLKEELKQSLPYLREKFLSRWAFQDISSSEIQQKKSYFNITLGNSERPFQTAIFEVSLPCLEDNEEQSILISMECKKTVDEYFCSFPDTVIFTDNNNRIVIVIDRFKTDFANECELLKTNLTNTYSCFVCIGISNKHKKLNEFPLGYKEACHALNYKTFVGKNQVVCYNDIIELGEQYYHSNPELLDKLFFNISAGSTENAISTLRNILSTPFSGENQLRMIAIDIISRCQYASIEQKIDEKNIESTKYLTNIFLSDNLPDLSKKLEGYVFKLTSTINTKNNIKFGSLIGQVKDYLNSKLSDPDLGLTSTAATFFVSPGHLGRLMKKETGMTFVEYLTSIRLKKAELLLNTTELKSYQVGAMVGISDPHYFSILFKKKVGISVNEYRNSIKKYV